MRLPEYCLRLHGLSRLSLVVDPFVGLGNTAIACARLGIDFIGIDIDAEYLDEAASRTREALAGAQRRRGRMPGRPSRGHSLFD